MSGDKIIKSLSILFCLSLFLPLSLSSGERSTENIDIEKFRAHTIVNRLLNENLKKLNLIEVISRNFGYSDYVKLKKDYWTARVLVSKKEIIQAQKLLEKNNAEMNESLKIISMDYQEAAQKMIDESIDKINEFEFIGIVNNLDNRRKLNMLRDKIKFASQLFDNANKGIAYQRYSSSITLFRSVKSYAISILKDLCEPGEENQIMDRFKIHIVDNRNEVYNKG